MLLVKYYFFVLVLLLSFLKGNAQEWKSLKKYKKETGFEILKDGCWLKKDRKRKNNAWSNANVFNLQKENGHEKYVSISQMRDFYIWFDDYRLLKGHTLEWVGYASLASKQLSKIDNDFLRIVVVHNKEVTHFVKMGSYKVFEFAFPLLKAVYNSKKLITGKEAIDWDTRYGELEQCGVIDVLYKNLSEKGLKQVNRMAKGKGIYGFGVPKAIRFKGNISDCNSRLNHILTKIQPYYKENRREL